MGLGRTWSTVQCCGCMIKKTDRSENHRMSWWFSVCRPLCLLWSLPAGGLRSGHSWSDWKLYKASNSESVSQSLCFIIQYSPCTTLVVNNIIFSLAQCFLSTCLSIINWIYSKHRTNISFSNVSSCGWRCLWDDSGLDLTWYNLWLDFTRLAPRNKWLGTCLKVHI